MKNNAFKLLAGLVVLALSLKRSAWIMIGLWFVQNLLAGYATIADAAAPDAGVAWFAHIGGFLAGGRSERHVAVHTIPPPDRPGHHLPARRARARRRRSSGRQGSSISRRRPARPS